MAASKGTRAGVANTLDRATFGKRLRSARKQFGWTLARLAALSGVSITTISRAERGQLALSYEKFSALGSALRVDMGSIFAEAGVPARPFAGLLLTRSGQGVVYRGQSFSYEFIGTSAVGKEMHPVLGTVHARRVEGPDDFARHPGEEFVHVLSGAITSECSMMWMAREGEAVAALPPPAAGAVRKPRLSSPPPGARRRRRG